MSKYLNKKYTKLTFISKETGYSVCALKNECLKAGIEIFYSTRVVRILKKDEEKLLLFLFTRESEALRESKLKIEKLNKLL